MSADIFISYRGADRVLARKLENRLRSRWGSRVFRDETGVTSGRGWARELHDAMREARVIIALVGPGWRLLDDTKTKDWVRAELLSAVKGGKPILPVLVGESEELRPKLEALPEAFDLQAVVVGPELAGFDMHRIAAALGRLGAFEADDAAMAGGRWDEMVPKQALQEAKQEIDNGESLLVFGSSGSGRNSLLQRLVADLSEEEHLVASYGLSFGAGVRHTHAVISGWLKSLGDAFQDFSSPYGVPEARQALVEAVLEAGPDLLSRRIVRAGTLLPLGGYQHDQQILKAVRRSTDRWAALNPTRLRFQSRQVLDCLIERLQKCKLLAERKLILVVDYYDSVDTNSEELVRGLIEEFGSRDSVVQFILATYSRVLNAEGQGKWRSALKEIDVEKETAWGDHLQPWLDAHSIELGEEIRQLIEGDPPERNPYRLLTRLWYLVDNGLVTEPSRQRASRSAKRKAESVPRKVKWLSTGDDETVKGLLTPDHLLDHLIEEQLPAGFRRLVKAGALMGRTFPFYAAYAATDPPKPGLSERERETWAAKAGACWKDLNQADPDHSVITCNESDSGEWLVSFAQAELIGHLRNQLGTKQAREYHERLAHYLVDPVRKIDQEYGDHYRRADLAAKHWTLAGQTREAADAHRNAAQIAEDSLAYEESKRHYHSAIRLYTQLAAEGKDQTRHHEDLLLLANCYYRVGQATRLSGKPKESKDDTDWGAINYLKRALQALSDLRTLLVENKPGGWRKRTTGPSTRGIPGPNLGRHYLRVFHAVSGHVHLEMGKCFEAAVDECRSHHGEELHSCDKCRNDTRLVRDHLFDTLRDAEAAQGEAGSRWLLADASAKLAALLANESLRTERIDVARAKALSVEAFFHIERVIGLKPYTDEEKHELAEPVSTAWRSAGRLFRHQALEPRVAEWCFRKMNKHDKKVSAHVDMMTDRWLGSFLLSICRPATAQAGRGQAQPDHVNLVDAEFLLERHRKWAFESGIAHWVTQIKVSHTNKGVKYRFGVLGKLSCPSSGPCC